MRSWSTSRGRPSSSVTAQTGVALLQMKAASTRACSDLVTGRLAPDAERSALGRLAAFGGVSRFPVRVKCASLAWHTLRSALGEGPIVVSTE